MAPRGYLFNCQAKKWCIIKSFFWAYGLSTNHFFPSSNIFSHYSNQFFLFCKPPAKEMTLVHFSKHCHEYLILKKPWERMIQRQTSRIFQNVTKMDVRGMTTAFGMTNKIIFCGLCNIFCHVLYNCQPFHILLWSIIEGWPWKSAFIKKTWKRKALLSEVSFSKKCLAFFCSKNKFKILFSSYLVRISK